MTLKIQIVTVAALVAVAGAGAAGGVMLSSGHDTGAPVGPAIAAPSAQTPATAATVQTSAPATRTIVVIAPTPVANPVRPVNNHHVATPADSPEPEAGVGADPQTVATPAPAHSVEQPVEPDPTPEPQLPSSDGMPTSMNGTPDPMVGGVSDPQAAPDGGNGGFLH